MSRDYRKIIAWQKTSNFACEVYRTTRDFPPEELCGGLGEHLRLAAARAATQIAEGASKRGSQSFVVALQEAQASLATSDCYLSLAQQLGYLDDEIYERLQELRSEAVGLVYGFTASIERGERGERRQLEGALETSEAV